MAEHSIAAPPERRIRKLDESVVNRIAAGEVVHRPASALKEMIENSLDAGASSITVVAKGGGMKLLEIRDNGHGIHKEDLPIVCERFTTSKLQKFDDLENISTYGFRGEALASISFVAHVSITSMTKDAPCAFRALYADGKLVPPAPNQKAEPKPCAGVRGTHIVVEDMFYNIPMRKKALKNQSEEYSRVLDVVSKYAIHYGAKGVGFTCKKHGSMSPDVHTLPKATVVDNIRVIYGSALSRELLPVKVMSHQSEPEEHSKQGPAGGLSGSAAANEPRFYAEGYVSNANYSMKKRVFILFINHRLVQSDSLKRAVDSVFSEFLPKGSHPFVYLSIELPPPHVDVNVHPTKREVQFLYETELTEAIVDGLQRVLAGANSSRTFYTQTLLSSGPVDAPSPRTDPITSSDAGAESPFESKQESPNPPSGFASSRLSRRHRNIQGNRVSLGGGEGNDFETSLHEDGNIIARTGIDIVAISTKDTDPSVKIRASPASSSSSPTPTPMASPPSARPARAGYPNKTVRTDSQTGNLRRFLVQGQGSEEGKKEGPIVLDDSMEGEGTEEEGPGLGNAREEESSNESDAVASAGLGRRSMLEQRKAERASLPPTQLTSIKELLQAVEERSRPGLTTTFQKHVYVGLIDESLSVIQHNTRLLVVNHAKLSYELFYQHILRFFGRLQSFHLSPSVPLNTLLTAAIEEYGLPDALKEDTVADVVQRTEELLLSKAPMLEEYFGVCLATNDEGRGIIRSLPRIVDGHCPQLSMLPDFILRLAWEVDWRSEKECFDTIARILAFYYSQLPPLLDEAGITRESEDHSLRIEKEVEARNDPESIYWVVEHIIFPATRSNFAPPMELVKRNEIVQVASTEQLYKIFERC